MTKKVLVVIGTRPEAIKLAPVVTAMQNNDEIDVKVCATGQHTDMLFPILDWFGVKRDYTLDVMRHQQPLSHLAGRLLSGIHDVIEEVHPDTVVVQGDTTSAFIGALAGYYGYDHFWKRKMRDKPIEIAHVEAGLRTGDNYSPYPEEMNRRLIGHMCHWNFAPTQGAADALHKEGIYNSVYVTGNTVIDALYATKAKLSRDGVENDALPELGADAKVILVTSHRRENYGEGLENVCAALKELAAKYRDENVHIVYPVHLNRNVQGPVHEMLGGVENIHLIAPLQYPDFVALMGRSHLILTDSGGVQEEAPSLGKPVLVMRDNTERPEALVAGTAKLVGTDKDKIVAATSELMDSAEAYHEMASAVNPYGDGQASRRIVNLLLGKPAGDNAFRYM